MAVRLTVVMVHTPPATTSGAALAETIVGELIGLPEIDLTLVGPLASLSATSTDRLTLESLTGDVAVLDWQAPAEILATLTAMGVQGDRWPHADDPITAPPRSDRRIYAFDLTTFQDARALCDAIGALKSVRQVRTFSIPLGPTSGKPTGPSRTGAAPTSPAAAKSTRRSESTADHPRAPETASPQSAGKLDLDDLLDKLDDLDP